MKENRKTVIFRIYGMTCVNCENHIEEDLGCVDGIIKVHASYSKNTAKVTYDPQKITIEEIIQVLEEGEFKAEELKAEELVNEKDKVEFSKKKAKKQENSEAKPYASVILFLVAAYLILNRTGLIAIFNNFPQAKENMGYGVLFLIGLLTSVHCIAMCGGINLTLCMSNQEKTDSESKFNSLRPSFLYNLGRVLSYTIVGGIVGGIGSVISFTGRLQGIIQLLAGLFMVIMGLNMLELFPGLRKFMPRMPKAAAKMMQKSKKSNGPFYVGMLNGLMPCGPLQAMQLYALSTGSIATGALSMFLFSLGTVPLMFGLGALSTVLTKKNSKKIMKFGAVLVVLLGISMFQSGAGLAGFNLSIPSGQNENVTAQMADGVQIVNTELTNGRYQPIVVEKGTKVRWNIQARQGQISGCNNRMIIREYGIEKSLSVGDNIIEFTPTETGTYTYTCWMGMIRSKIVVVEPGQQAQVTEEETYDSVIMDSFNDQYKIPAKDVVFGTVDDDMQSVSFGVKDGQFTPAVIVLERGKKTEVEIVIDGLDESNQALAFPLYGQTVSMQEGENYLYVMPVTDFTIASIDYQYFAYVKVVDDLSEADLDEIKETVLNYQISENDYVYSEDGASCH